MRVEVQLVPQPIWQHLVPRQVVPMHVVVIHEEVHAVRRQLEVTEVPVLRRARWGQGER